MIVKFYFCKPTAGYKKLFSTIMQVGENVNFGHVAIGLESYSGINVYESVFPRSQKTKLSDFLKHYAVVSEVSFEVPKHLHYQVYEYLESSIGHRYALEQVLLMSLLILFKPLDYFFNLTVFNHNKAMVCTELFSRFAEKFMSYKMRESHDKFGLNDCQTLVDTLERDPKWILS